MSDENASVGSITSSQPEKPGMPGPVGPDPLTRDAVLDQKMGAVGRKIGYGDEKKGNIAACVILFFFLLLIFCVIAHLASHSEENRAFLGNLITPLFGVITGAIGYITGRHTN